MKPLIKKMSSLKLLKVELIIDGFGSYKLYFVPHAKDIESELLRFFDGVMNNT